MIFCGGCEKPFDKSPAGYADACYGGEREWKRNAVCSEQRLMVTTPGRPEDWPLLAEIVSDFGRTRSLKVFDTSTYEPEYIRTIEVSVCSAEGLFLYVNQRIYKDERFNEHGDVIRMTLSTYRNSFQWSPVANEFVAMLREKWAHPTEIEWPKPRGSHRALPDSVPNCDETS